MFLTTQGRMRLGSLLYQWVHLPSHTNNNTHAYFHKLSHTRTLTHSLSIYRHLHSQVKNTCRQEEMSTVQKKTIPQVKVLILSHDWRLQKQTICIAQLQCRH